MVLSRPGVPADTSGASAPPLPGPRAGRADSAALRPTPPADLAIATTPSRGQSDDAAVADATAAVFRQAPATPARPAAGDFSPELCRSPRPYDEDEEDVDQEQERNHDRDTPDTSSSDGSMRINRGDDGYTPPDTPDQRHSPAAADVPLERLSLEHQHHHTHNHAHTPLVSPRPVVRGRGHVNGPQVGSTGKRSASQDLQRPPGRQSPGGKVRCNDRSAGARAPGDALQSHSPAGHEQAVGSHPEHGQNGPQQPHWQDSGYASNPSKTNTLQAPLVDSGVMLIPTPGPMPSEAVPPTAHLPQPNPRPKGILTIAQKAKYPGMILQPDSSSITEAQLTAEIKGIYAGLIIVEAKCINIDAAQAANPNTQLDAEHWQALIALHRTYLYEHHDFMMATQHPAATSTLRELPTRYSMPARMWKHGIHAFLEVLRHRRPDSQEYMLSFICLAYQMVALLYETVPVFLDTWIECLGDLARYRMAIEEEREPHAQWGSVAASWYIEASDRHPEVGRLYHHLAILERPSLRKFAYYGKSLTCVVPFPNARDSLSILCGPIAEEAQPARPPSLFTEATFCKLHAEIFLAKPDAVIRATYDKGMALLQQPGGFRWPDCGVPLAVTNLSALLGHGSPLNPIRLSLDFCTRQIMERRRAANAPPVGPQYTLPTNTDMDNPEKFRLLLWSKKTTLACWDTQLQCRTSAALHGTVAFFHVMISFAYTLSLADRECSASSRWPTSLNTARRSLLGLDELPWGGICEYLNTLSQLFPITSQVVQHAQQGTWPSSERGPHVKPLPEDYTIRGLVWAYFYFCPGWFDHPDEDHWARHTELADTHERRVERGYYWALRLAFETNYISYNPGSKTFSPTTFAGVAADDAASVAVSSPSRTSTISLTEPPSRHSSVTWPSSASEKTVPRIPQPNRPPHAPGTISNPIASTTTTPAKTWAAVAAHPSPAPNRPARSSKTPKVGSVRPTKHRPNLDNVRIVDDASQWHADEHVDG